MGRNRGAYKRDRKEGDTDRQPGNRGAKDGYIGAEELRTLENPAFTKFYRGAVVPEAEWEACLDSFRTCLPSCFRVNSALPTAEAIRDLIVREMKESNTPLNEVHFVPQRMAFQTPMSRGEIKRDAAMKHVKQLMRCFNEEGLISRQEAVSMIPPVLLDVQPGHRVIDMCAAPGSKTTQILERLAAQGPGGVVVANDVNPGRLDVLTHQTARLPDAKSRLIITNHDATAFPLVMSSADKFDRVLCDVMCSGDGTLRKSMDLWQRWGPLMGPHLHVSQARVLMRGMGLCKAGGIVVYSTCSLNPVEDEAVIAKCLQEADGAFELIDPAVALPGLRYYPGKHTWRLLAPDGQTEIDSVGDDGTLTLEKGPKPNAKPAGTEEADAAEDNKRPPRRGGKAKFTYTASMFPPAPEVAAALKLERCVRVAPHLQDTGGFFIAGLRCVRELPGSISASVRSKYDPPMKPISDEILAEVRRGVGLPDGFPTDRLFCQHEATRNPKVYYLSPDCAATARGMNAKVVQAGVKVFESPVKRSWVHSRVTPEGAATLAPLLGDLVATTTAATAVAVVDKYATEAQKNQFVLSESAFRTELTTRCPETLPPSGVLAVECGPTLGNVYLAFDRRESNMTLRYTSTQIGLLHLAIGRPLVAPDDRVDDAESDAGDEQGAPEQPAAE